MKDISFCVFLYAIQIINNNRGFRNGDMESSVIE
jgi:hypothetical protein